MLLWPTCLLSATLYYILACYLLHCTIFFFCCALCCVCAAAPGWLPVCNAAAAAATAAPAVPVDVFHFTSAAAAAAAAAAANTVCVSAFKQQQQQQQLYMSVCIKLQTQPLPPLLPLMLSLGHYVKGLGSGFRVQGLGFRKIWGVQVGVWGSSWGLGLVIKDSRNLKRLCEKLNFRFDPKF